MSPILWFVLMAVIIALYVLAHVLLAQHNAREWQKGHDEHMARMDAIRERRNQ